MRKGAFWSVRFWHRIWPGVRRGATRWHTRWHTATPQCRSIKRCLQHFPPAIFWRRDQHWTKAYGVVRDFRGGLEGLKEYNVSFRVPEPEQYMVRSAYAGA